MSKNKKRIMMPGGPKEIDGSKFTVLSGLTAIFEIKEVRIKFLITLFILFIFRLGSHIPVPGIDISALAQATNANSSGLMDFIDMFAGGALRRFTLFTLGIMPYISAEIILQLLMSIIPSWKKMSQDDQEKAKDFMQFWSRALTILLAGVQSALFIQYMIQQNASSQTPFILIDSIPLFYIVAILAITSGTMFLIWLGDKIDEYGIGNGASMIIFAGIISRMPSAFRQLYKTAIERNIFIMIVMLIMFIFIIILIIYVQRGKRKLMVGGSKAIKGGKISMIPAFPLNIPINPSGVIPIIFASIFLQLPAQILNPFAAKSAVIRSIIQALYPGTGWYIAINSILILAFSYFYSQFQLNPEDIAGYLTKSGRTLKGTRAGGDVASEIKKTVNRIILPGAIFLAFIAAIPDIVNKVFNLPSEFSYIMGGTSILIIAGVAFDIATKLEGIRRFRGRGQ
ncbi:MAG: preprotein translocase subunit SecY [Spirochaetes bacterium]|nr:preprotein translocase subunit SecY [Spirochaetota bacterium]NLJ05814.1 preprotein translocase subunit SecY [Exilispira sp.]HOV45605.1 preprotein translocase subunit SecY [Exilispira sp.]